MARRGRRGPDAVHRPARRRQPRQRPRHLASARFKPCEPPIASRSQWNLGRAEAKGRLRESWPLDYDRIFKSAIERLHDEGRYRVFIDILRTKGSFPNAIASAATGPKPITVWCSNDYLGMGQHPSVVEAMENRASRRRRGLGRHPQHQRQHALSHRARGGACRPARQGWRAALHLGLRFERGRALYLGQAPSRTASSSRTSSTTPR